MSDREALFQNWWRASKYCQVIYPESHLEQYARDGFFAALDLTSEGEAAELSADQPEGVVCSLGVGCDEYGVCYALAQGQPEQCGRPTHANGGQMEAPQPAQPDLESRDIWECANQLFGYISPSTPDNLVAFLNREGHAALNLAQRLTDAQAHITALTAEVKRLGELADGYGKLDLEYAALTEKVEELTRELDAAHEARERAGCIMSLDECIDMLDANCETAEARVAQLEQALEKILTLYQVTHCHAAARSALHPEKEGE